MGLATLAVGRPEEARLPTPAGRLAEEELGRRWLTVTERRALLDLGRRRRGSARLATLMRTNPKPGHPCSGQPEEPD